jgi:leader peptidase (prepilin peptidase)/N-methyltransferase
VVGFDPTRVFGETIRRTSKSVQAIIVCAVALLVAISVLAAPDLLRGAAGIMLGLTMLAIAAIDARRFIIPDQLNAIGLAFALVNAGIQNQDALMQGIASSALRAASLAFLFLGLRMGYRWLRNREGIGLGDVKLAAVAGAWLDWWTMPVAVEIAAVLALGSYLVRQLMSQKSLDPTNKVPFGLFFGPAIWFAWLVETSASGPF